MVQVAPRQLNEFRARYVISDVLSHRGRNDRIVAVMHDKGRYADSRKNRMRAHLDVEREHEFSGPRARRQAFMSRPRGPDFLIPRHVRIDHMFQFAGSPRGGDPVDDFLNRFRAYRPVHSALAHDQRGRAGRMCCREQRRCRECTRVRDQSCFAAPESVEHRGYAVGPLLQSRQRARRDRIGRSCAGWSKKIS